MAMSKAEKDMMNLKKQNKLHKGEWLTKEAVVLYQAKVAKLSGKEDVGERRRIRIEFQERYGLQELEAINILNGYHVQIYLRKYERIKNLIPLVVEKDKLKDWDDEDEFE